MKTIFLLRLLTVLLIILISIEALHLAEVIELNGNYNGFLMLSIGILSFILAYMNYKKQKKA